MLVILDRGPRCLGIFARAAALVVSLATMSSPQLLRPVEALARDPLRGTTGIHELVMVHDGKLGDDDDQQAWLIKMGTYRGE